KSSARVSHTSHRTRCFITRLPTGSSLVPYTTLFRSWQNLVLVGIGAAWTVTAAGRERFQRVSQSWRSVLDGAVHVVDETVGRRGDRKSTRLNSSHVKNSYDVFCVKKQNTTARASRAS